MKTEVLEIDRNNVIGMLRASILASVSDQQEKAFSQCLKASHTVWLGLIEGKAVCVWGLIPPTLMSMQAYLWLHTTEDIKDHMFIFVRHSKIQIEKMLEKYDSIVGHVDPNMPSSMRWLSWLGARFREPEGRLVPFIITKHKPRRSLAHG